MTNHTRVSLGNDIRVKIFEGKVAAKEEDPLETKINTWLQSTSIAEVVDVCQSSQTVRDSRNDKYDHLVSTVTIFYKPSLTKP